MLLTIDSGSKYWSSFSSISIKHFVNFCLYFNQTFASWGVDYLKLDGCHSTESQFDVLYPQVTVALNKTGRPIVFSCSWPADQTFMGIKVWLLNVHCRTLHVSQLLHRGEPGLSRILIFQIFLCCSENEYAWTVCLVQFNLVPRVLWLFGQRVGARRDWRTVQEFWVLTICRKNPVAVTFA